MLVTVPSGQMEWRIELCHFPDCSPGIVFHHMSAVQVKHCKSIKRSFLRFCNVARRLLQDTAVCGWEGSPLARKIQTKVSLLKKNPSLHI